MKNWYVIEMVLVEYVVGVQKFYNWYHFQEWIVASKIWRKNN